MKFAVGLYNVTGTNTVSVFSNLRYLSHINRRFLFRATKGSVNASEDLLLNPVIAPPFSVILEHRRYLPSFIDRSNLEPKNTTRL